MKQADAIRLRNRISSLVCYSKKDIEALLGFSYEIKGVVNFLEGVKPDGATNLHLSYGQLLESESGLQSWLDRPDKNTMAATFSEYKSDFISVLDDYIEMGDSCNVWEK